MPKSTAFSNALLNLIFKNTAITGIAEPSSPAGSYYLALCTADPGYAGTAITNETAYPGYARKPIARVTGFTETITSGVSSFSNTAAVTFNKVLSGTNPSATHIALVTTSSGAGMILYSEALDDVVPLVANVIPEIAIGAFVVKEDPAP